eukprot:gene1230-2386_t
MLSYLTRSWTNTEEQNVDLSFGMPSSHTDVEAEDSEEEEEENHPLDLPTGIPKSKNNILKPDLASYRSEETPTDSLKWSTHGAIGNSIVDSKKDMTGHNAGRNVNDSVSTKGTPESTPKRSVSSNIDSKNNINNNNNDDETSATILLHQADPQSFRLLLWITEVHLINEMSVIILSDEDHDSILRLEEELGTKPVFPILMMDNGDCICGLDDVMGFYSDQYYLEPFQSLLQLYSYFSFGLLPLLNDNNNNNNNNNNRLNDVDHQILDKKASVDHINSGKEAPDNVVQLTPPRAPTQTQTTSQSQSQSPPVNKNNSNNKTSRKSLSPSSTTATTTTVMSSTTTSIELGAVDAVAATSTTTSSMDPIDSVLEDQKSLFQQNALLTTEVTRLRDALSRLVKTFDEDLQLRKKGDGVHIGLERQIEDLKEELSRVRIDSQETIHALETENLNLQRIVELQNDNAADAVKAEEKVRVLTKDKQDMHRVLAMVVAE